MADLDDVERLARLGEVAALAPAAGAGASEELLRAMLASAPALVFLLDPGGRILWGNRMSSPGSLGRAIFDFLPPEGDQDARAALERCVRTAEPDQFTGFGQGKRGPRSRYENWIGPVVREGRVIALVMISRDVSEQWALYDALRDREERLSLVLSAAGMGTWRFDFGAKTVELDERARAIYGLSVARLDSLVFSTTYIHPDDRVEVDRCALESARTRRPYVAQNRILRSDAQVRWVEITGSPIVDEHGALVALMGTVVDVTARRELEERARQAQRLDAVGSLTAGIAHNFNNLLAAMMPALRMVETEVSPTSLPVIRGASLATERAADLVRQLMTFAGRSPGQTTVQAPGVLAERIVALCRSTFDRMIDLRLTLEPGLPSIRVDVGQIEQALLNLLLNARDAVRDASAPTVHVHITTAARPELGERRMVAFVVEDNGPGVPEELRERIFDPFFTTKPVGSGTGLGLATAYAIAREHGGSLTCDGAPGRGACFTLLIPEGDGVPAIAPPVTRSSTSLPGTVLVVDDDVLVRRTVSRVLADEGFKVFEAENADRAMALLQVERSIDVVLLDLNMPGSPWRAAVEQMRRDHPQTRVVAFTGGVTRRDDSLDGWLTKPAPPEAIIDAINHAISATR